MIPDTHVESWVEHHVQSWVEYHVPWYHVPWVESWYTSHWPTEFSYLWIVWETGGCFAFEKACFPQHFKTQTSASLHFILRENFIVKVKGKIDKSPPSLFPCELGKPLLASTHTLCLPSLPAGCSGGLWGDDIPANDSATEVPPWHHFLS